MKEQNKLSSFIYLWKHFQNGRERLAEILFLHKAMGTLSKIVKISFFRTLEINEGQQPRDNFFFQWLNLSENSEFCNVLA